MVKPMVASKVIPCKKSKEGLFTEGTSNVSERRSINKKKLVSQGTSRYTTSRSLRGQYTEIKQSDSKGTSNASTLECGAVKDKQDSSSNICRVCLKEGDIPIYDTSKSEDISSALAVFGGIEIKEDDAYPKYLCSYCHALLQGAILFRKMAQESDQILKKPQEVKQDDSGDGFMEDEDFDDQIPAKKLATNHCKRCDIYFKTLKEYKEHTLTEEHESRRQTCPVCQKSLSVLYYKKHLLLHNLKTPPNVCDICGKTFSFACQLTRHRVTHFNELPFKCDHCPYRGRFAENLKEHMRRHTGEKPFQCAECAARFSNRSNLNKHMRTHKEKRDHNCETCGRGFHTKKNLDMHLRVDHVGIKDQICNICGKAFGYRKQMMKHQLKVHKREKMSKGKVPLYLQVEQANNNGVSET